MASSSFPPSFTLPLTPSFPCACIFRYSFILPFLKLAPGNPRCPLPHPAFPYMQRLLKDGGSPPGRSPPGAVAASGSRHLPWCAARPDSVNLEKLVGGGSQDAWSGRSPAFAVRILQGRRHDPECPNTRMLWVRDTQRHRGSTAVPGGHVGLAASDDWKRLFGGLHPPLSHPGDVCPTGRLARWPTSREEVTRRVLRAVTGGRGCGAGRGSHASRT